MRLEKTDQTVLGRLRPSGTGRVIGVMALSGLGGVLLMLGLRNAGVDPGVTLLMLAAGMGVFWIMWRMWQATSHALILTPDALMSSDGQVLAQIADIVSVDWGVFALKPAGGFSLVLRRAGPRAWQPGLWWRSGRRIGIGGATNRHQARQMAERISSLVAARRPG